MLPAIPFTIWLFILCGLWSHRSVDVFAPAGLGRSASADLESLESCKDGPEVTEFLLVFFPKKKKGLWGFYIKTFQFLNRLELLMTFSLGLRENHLWKVETMTIPPSTMEVSCEFSLEPIVSRKSVSHPLLGAPPGPCIV
jgi:hypothetical protein